MQTIYTYVCKCTQTVCKRTLIILLNLYLLCTNYVSVGKINGAEWRRAEKPIIVCRSPVRLTRD